MKQVYTTPDFDVSLYDVEDIITISVGTRPVEARRRRLGGNLTCDILTSVQTHRVY